ncbi:MAG: leucine-rich repeat domain-containing protein, partial [Oscillospiraceae bacterium]
MKAERATGHTYADGVCSVCGHSQLDDMTFAESDDGNSYTLTAYESRAWDTVAIPDTCNGKPVAAIADGTTLMGMVLQTGVFMGHTEIERVIVGENLKTVGVGAFSGCTSLESIDLGSVTGLGKWAFQNCSSLAEAELNEGITELADYVFTRCASLEDIALPAGLVSIGASTFSGCSALQSISLPSGLESIGASAFSGCSSAAGTLTIPASLTSMGTGAFSGCSSIEAVTIEAVMDSLPNAAFQNCTSLLTVNSSEEGTYDLSGFTAIGTNVFLGTPVQRVIFDEELASVGGVAFQGCAQLVQLDFGENTAALAFNGQQTFQNCTSLEEV